MERKLESHALASFCPAFFIFHAMALTQSGKEPVNFLKSSWLVSVCNFISRITGFLREVIRANYLGASGLSDAFQMAFSIPNLFRRLTAEGVMLSSFLPIFGEIHHQGGEEAAKRFYLAIFWWLAMILTAFCALFIYYADFLIQHVFATGFRGETLATTIFLTRIMFGYIAFISIAALFQGVLNHHRIFWVSASTPILLNVLVVACGIVAGILHNNVAVAFSYGVIIGGFLQAFVQLPFVLKLGYSFFKKGKLRQTLSHPYLGKLLKVSLPGILGAGIYQIDIVVSNIIASGLEEGSISALNFSNRLLELTLGIFIVSQTTVLLPHMVKRIQQKDFDSASSDLTNMLGLISFFTLPMCVGMMLCADEIIRLLFQRGEFNEHAVFLTHQALVLHLPGLLAIGWNRALITVFQARQLFKLTMTYAFFTLVVNIGVGYITSRYIGNGGIAFANTLSQSFLTCLFLYFITKKTAVKIAWQPLLKNAILKHIVAVIGLALAVLAVQFFWPTPSSLRFVAEVMAASSIFGTLALLLRAPEAANILQLFKKK